MKFEIPTTFNIGGVKHTVKIERIVGENCDFGQFDPTGVISLALQVGGPREVSQTKREQTFCHELTHAILFAMRKDDLYEDESFVNTFSSFLYEAISTAKTKEE